MKLNLSAENFTCLKWWVDASQATHKDCGGHTGAMLSLGKGSAISLSNKHKINTKSSTESKLVGVDQALPSILHTQNFIEAQGFTVEQNIIFQDNQSTMQLCGNGSASSSKRKKTHKMQILLHP